MQKIGAIPYIKFDNFYALPQRAHDTDVGADVFAADTQVIKARSVGVIGLGFGIKLPKGFMACMYPKSGLTSKGLLSTLPPVDPGYTGEVHAILYNFTDEDITIERGQKVAQMIISRVYIDESIEAKTNESRGQGAFGSTGKF